MQTSTYHVYHMHGVSALRLHPYRLIHFRAVARYNREMSSGKVYQYRLLQHTQSTLNANGTGCAIFNYTIPAIVNGNGVVMAWMRPAVYMYTTYVALCRVC